MRIVLLVLLLAGCSALVNMNEEDLMDASPAQSYKKIADAKRLCMKRYGYLPGSSSFEQCMEENAPGMKAEIQKSLEKDEMVANARTECEKAGYPKDSDAFFECVSMTLDNMARAEPPRKRRR